MARRWHVAGACPAAYDRPGRVQQENEDDDTDEGKKPDEIPKKDKIIACRYGIPILLLALADYLYGYMDFENCGFLHKDIFG